MIGWQRVTRDWLAWHRDYDDASTSLSRRLSVVQHHLRTALRDGVGSLQLISVCAGAGRDVLPVLADSNRDVRALLVELDTGLAQDARGTVRRLGLANVRVVTGNAGTTDVYADFVPAQVVLVCGVFGNISDDDVRQTIAVLPTLTAPGGVVIWTRGRQPDDPTSTIRSFFAEHGFNELAFVAPEDDRFSVGVHRLTADAARPYEADRRMFVFA